MGNIKIYAHRGGPQKAPENTIAAFKAAISAGADGVECDIRRTADGQFVACHDRTLARVAGHDWPVAETTWAHLKTLRVAGREPLAHLDDILNLMILRPGREFFFELALARPQDAADLALQVKKAGMQERSFLLAFSNGAKFLKAAKEAVPAIGLAVMPLFPSDLLATARAAGADRVCTGWTDFPLSRQLFTAGAALCALGNQVCAARAAGVEVSAGVANHPREVRWLAALGLPAVWTDDVEMALKHV